MQSLLIEVVGWIGALLILSGYALLTSGRVTAQSPLYQWLNVVGAAGFIVNGVANEAYPSAGLNIVWMGIGAVALWNIARRRGSSTSVT
jgi:hypothetical protein